MYKVKGRHPNWRPLGGHFQPVLTAVIATLAVSAALRQDNPGKIVFVSDRDGNPEIYSMSADGSNVKRLTDNNANDKQPCWSTDGTKIAWASNRSGDWDI